MRVRSVARLFAVICALVITLATSTVPVHASTYCLDSSINNQWDGLPSPGQVYGVKGQIVDRYIYLCTGSDDDSAASVWVMLTGHGVNEYAQVGYWKEVPLTWLRFVEYNTGTAWQRVNFSSPSFSSGLYRWYQVSYSTSDQHIHFYINGSQVYYTPWSPNDEWSTPWESQFMGETWDRGDDVPGSFYYKAGFRTLSTQKCTSCGYTNPYDHALVSTQGVYKNAWVGRPYAFDVWTQR